MGRPDGGRAEGVGRSGANPNRLSGGCGRPGDAAGTTRSCAHRVHLLGSPLARG